MGRDTLPVHPPLPHPSRSARSVSVPAPVMAMFQRFVQPGRLALITYGPCEGKICTITDIVDQKRVVVDGPEALTGVRRHMMPIRRLSLTDFRVKIPRGAREKTLKKALAEDDALKKFDETAWGKKIKSKAARANMTDFERFKLMVARKNRAKAAKGKPVKKTKGKK